MALALANAEVARQGSLHLGSASRPSNCCCCWVTEGQLKAGNRQALMGPLSGGTCPPGHCARVSRFQILWLAVSIGEADVTDAKSEKNAR